VLALVDLRRAPARGRHGRASTRSATSSR